MKYYATYCSDLYELNTLLSKINSVNGLVVTITENCGYTVIYKANKMLY